MITSDPVQLAHHLIVYKTDASPVLLPTYPRPDVTRSPVKRDRRTDRASQDGRTSACSAYHASERELEILTEPGIGPRR